MFEYTVPTDKAQHFLPHVQAICNKQIAKGLKTIRIEAHMTLRKLCARILRERWAHTTHAPCPLLSVRKKADGPMVYISQAGQSARRMNTYADDTKMCIIVPLRDYWYTVLRNERRPESAPVSDYS